MDKKVIMHIKGTFGIALFLGLVLCACSCKTISLEAFTHPYNLNQVPTYRSPNKFYSYLLADTEGGWIVEIQKQREGSFYVKLPSECELPKKDIWLKAGDIGVVIQNYDSIEIPMYLSADTLSVPVTNISNSVIGIICSIKKNLFYCVAGTMVRKPKVGYKRRICVATHTHLVIRCSGTRKKNI